MLTAAMIGCRDNAEKVLKAPDVAVPADVKKPPKQANEPNWDFNLSLMPDFAFDEERATKDRKYVENWLKYTKKEEESILKKMENDPITANAIRSGLQMDIKKFEEMLKEHDRKNAKKE